VSSTPTLPVVDLPEAVAFYESAGFGVRIYRDESGNPGDFAFADFDGLSVFDLDVVAIDPARNGAGCYLIVGDADGWHARMVQCGLPVTAIADQPWGMREFTLTDPSGNHVRSGEAPANGNGALGGRLMGVHRRAIIAMLEHRGRGDRRERLMRRALVLLGVSIALVCGPGAIIGVPPAGAATTITAADFAADCNADGIWGFPPIGGLTPVVHVRGGVGELTTNCQAIIPVRGTLNFIDATLTSKCCGLAVLGARNTTLGIASVFDLTGSINVLLGFTIPQPFIAGGAGRIFVKTASLRGDNVRLRASPDPDLGGVVQVIGSDLTSLGGGIDVQAGILGQASVSNSSLTAGGGDIVISTAALSRTAATGNRFVTVAPYAVRITTGAFGICISVANAPAVPCT
jgi:uncharacterized glyoxalase superfamily protein PhnB